MNLSGYQWFGVIVLDVLIRAGYFFVASFHALYVPFALVLSLMHLTFLILADYSVASFEPPARAAVAATIIATNVLFFGIFISVWLYLIKSGRQTVCVGTKCEWIDGAITWRGFQTIALQSLIQFVINVVPFLVMCAWRNRNTPLQGRSSLNGDQGS